VYREWDQPVHKADNLKEARLRLSQDKPVRNALSFCRPRREGKTSGLGQNFPFEGKGKSVQCSVYSGHIRWERPIAAIRGLDGSQDPLFHDTGSKLDLRRAARRPLFSPV